jgi:uncharacterized protein (UPF0335 family)|tara:strand:+ start:1515 stop:1733 length:219 start_codon:yes stop_codon:yes gene_type:complete
MNQKDAISSLVKLYIEEESLSEQVKEIKDMAKDSGLDPAILSAVAKAIVKNKVDDLRVKSDEILKAIEVSRS